MMITANIFEIFGSGLLLTQKEQCVSGSAAVCVTSLPWLISCRVICENAGQVLIALSFGGDDWALLNPSPVASSPGFAGLAPLLPSPLWLHTEIHQISPYAVQWQRLPKKLSLPAKQLL